MDCDVPYLTISEFERRGSEELLKLLKNNEDDQPERLISRETIPKNFTADDGYSHYVELVLQGMGMEKYCSLFEEEDISIEILIHMQDDDLEKLGITDLEDRKCILKQLQMFIGDVNDFIPVKHSENESGRNDQEMVDYVIITRNVYQHLLELNSHLAYLHFKLSKNCPEDYFICNYESGLKFLKFVINHAAIQTDRISQLLFNGQFSGRNLITDTLKVSGITLPEHLKEKLTGCHKKTKKLRKGRLITSVLIGIGVVVTIGLISKKK